MGHYRRVRGEIKAHVQTLPESLPVLKDPWGGGLCIEDAPRPFSSFACESAGLPLRRDKARAEFSDECTGPTLRWYAAQPPVQYKNNCLSTSHDATGRHSFRPSITVVENRLAIERIAVVGPFSFSGSTSRQDG